ncbi:hypothetical protein ABTD43_19675, partial [Acinetobacter baumannii]
QDVPANKHPASTDRETPVNVAGTPEVQGVPLADATGNRETPVNEGDAQNRRDTSSENFEPMSSRLEELVGKRLDRYEIL